MIITGAVVLFRHIPNVKKILNGQEIKYTLREDLTYKLDNKF